MGVRTPGYISLPDTFTNTADSIETDSCAEIIDP